jgi:hypothetical protein
MVDRLFFFFFKKLDVDTDNRKSKIKNKKHYLRGNQGFMGICRLFWSFSHFFGFFGHFSVSGILGSAV